LLHTGLRILGDQFDLPAEQAACGIDFFRRKDEGVGHWLSVEIETTGEIMDPADENIVRREGFATDKRWPDSKNS
jgi:hypothetical protein